jgi:hypothetical protein
MHKTFEEVKALLESSYRSSVFTEGVEDTYWFARKGEEEVPVAFGYYTPEYAKIDVAFTMQEIRDFEAAALRLCGIKVED